MCARVISKAFMHKKNFKNFSALVLSIISLLEQLHNYLPRITIFENYLNEIPMSFASVSLGCNNIPYTGCCF